MKLTETAHFDRMPALNHEKQGLCMRAGICTREVCQKTAILGELGQEGVERGKSEIRIRDLALPGVSALLGNGSSGDRGD